MKPRKGLNLNCLNTKKQIALFCAGAFLSFAPLWTPPIQQVWGRNLFMTADSMVLLGVTLLVSLLAFYVLPDFLVRTGVSNSCQNHTKAQRPSAVPGGLRFGIGLLSIAFLVWVLHWVNQNILHAFLSSGDEHSCYFLAECLRSGKLYVEIPPLADFFKVVHVGMRDGKWFSVYPLGWPLIWAAGLNFNVVNWLNPIFSAGAVFFFYLTGARLFGRLTAVLGLLMMCLSPFFMFTAASYFSHATCLLMISVFLYSFLRWRAAAEGGRDSIGWALLCAVAVGYGLMTRYLTMAIIVFPFMLYQYLPVFFEWHGWRQVAWIKLKLPIPMIALKHPQLRKSDWIFLAIVTVFMLLIFTHNYAISGKPFKAPNKFDKSWERLGFRGDYTMLDGLFYVVGRIFYLMDWFAPALVATYLIIVFRKRRHDLLRQLFRLGMVFLAFAYFFYYSWGGNQWGPRYYWEGMPFLCIAVADWIVCQWREGSLRARKFLLVFVIASIVTSGVLFVRHAEFTEEASRQRRALYDLAEETLQQPAIVFIRGFLGDRLVMAQEDTVRNSPFLDGEILYAHDLGGGNKELMAHYPDREYYRGSYDRKVNEARLERLSR